MNCQDVERILDDHHEGMLAPAERDKVDHHLAACDDCAAAWHTSQALLGMRKVNAPEPRPALFEKAMERATRYSQRAARGSFWRGVSVGGVLAASLALAAVLLVSPNPAEQVHSIPKLTMSLNETRNVSVAIDSVQPLTDVRIRVLLAGGIRLANFEDRNLVDWNTELGVGANRLTLPLVALDRAGGDLLVEIEHENKRKVFAVRIDVDELDAVKNLEPFGVSSV